MMNRTNPFLVPISLTLLLSVSVILSRPSMAGEWEFRVKPKGTLRIVDFYVPSTSPWVNYAEGLVSVDKDCNYVPCLARDWRWIDEQTIEFRIREGVRFQNGEKFNAEALRINWEAYKKLEQPRMFRFTGLPDETVLEITDDYTVRFTFPNPDGLALAKLRWFFQIAPSYLAKHQFPEKNWARLSEGGPWGTGPFKLVEGSVLYGKPSLQIVLEANDDYWDERYPKVRKVVFNNGLIADREEALRLCMDQEGKVDIVTFIRPLDTLKVAESRHAKVVKNRGVMWFGGYFNQRKKSSKWQDIRLRKAVNYSINREELRKYAAKGNACNLGAPLANVFPLQPDLTPFTYDTTKARLLLKEAGYPNGFELTIMTHQAWQLEAKVIAEMLKRIGLEVKLEVLTYPELLSKIYIPMMRKAPEETEWDIAIEHIANFAGHLGLSFFFWWLQNTDFSIAGYDPVMEKMFTEMANSVDHETQWGKLREMANYVHERAMKLDVYSPLALYAANREVTFVPYGDTIFRLKETSVTENHWSVRGQNN